MIRVLTLGWRTPSGETQERRVREIKFDSPSVRVRRDVRRRLVQLDRLNYYYVGEGSSVFRTSQPTNLETPVPGEGRDDRNEPDTF